MKFIFTNKITIILEILAIFICLIWFLKERKEEPLFSLIGACAAFIGSCVAIINLPKPKLELHNIQAYAGHISQGLTSNNPKVIDDATKVERHYKIVHGYDLELRNNSSTDAYKIEINFTNKPKNLSISGSIGKIEPIKANEKKEFHYKVSEYVNGTPMDAKSFVRDLPEEQLKNFQLNVIYTNEDNDKFATTYHWYTDKNEFKGSIWRDLMSKIGIVLSILLVITFILLYSGQYVSVKRKISSPSKEINDTVKKVKEPIKTNYTKSETSDRKVDEKHNKFDTTANSPITVKADNGSIATFNQVGDNTVVNNYEKPNMKIEYISSVLNEKVTTLPLSGRNMEYRKLPNEKYNYEHVYKSSLTVKYIAPVVMNGFGYLSKTSDCILMDISHVGRTFKNAGSYHGKLFVAAMQPDNGQYTFIAYTTKEIESIDEVFQLLQ